MQPFRDSNKNSLKTYLPLFALGLLTTCTHAPLAPTIAYQPTSTDKTIVLLTPYIPPAPRLISIAPITAVGAVGGILGFAYDQSVQRDHAKVFDALLQQSGFSASTRLQQNITQQLEAEGYTVHTQAVDRPTPDFLTTYPPAAPGASLELDVVLQSIGYVATTVTSPYQPIIEMKYRLVHAGSGDVLAQGVFQYSIDRGDIHPDPKYDYWHYRNFSTNPSIAVAALDDGLGQAAGVIASELH